MRAPCSRWSKCGHHNIWQPLIVSKPVTSFFSIISIPPSPALTLGKFKTARRVSDFYTEASLFFTFAHCCPLHYGLESLSEDCVSESIARLP